MSKKKIATEKTEEVSTKKEEQPVLDLFFNTTITYNVPTTVVADDGTVTYTETANNKVISASAHYINSSENIKYGRELSAVIAKIYTPPKFNDGTTIDYKHQGKISWDGFDWRIIGVVSADQYNNRMVRLIVERDV